MKFKFKKGDRVDFCLGEGLANSTPGTIRNRVNTAFGGPAYKVDWDDEYDDRTDSQVTTTTDNIWYEDNLMPLPELSSSVPKEDA